MIFMPLAYSISDGILLGHLAYVIINLFSGNRKILTPGMYVLAVIFVLKFILH
jgi:AGZA family xanthine/uracil permease-like MFS transporter